MMQCYYENGQIYNSQGLVVGLMRDPQHSLIPHNFFTMDLEFRNGYQLYENMGMIRVRTLRFVDIPNLVFDPRLPWPNRIEIVNCQIVRDLNEETRFDEVETLIVLNSVFADDVLATEVLRQKFRNVNYAQVPIAMVDDLPRNVEMIFFTDAGMPAISFVILMVIEEQYPNLQYVMITLANAQEVNEFLILYREKFNRAQRGDGKPFNMTCIRNIGFPQGLDHLAEQLMDGVDRILNEVHVSGPPRIVRQPLQHVPPPPVVPLGLGNAPPDTILSPPRQ